MSLDLRNFVQVNIEYHKINANLSSEKGIVTLITINNAYSSNPYAGTTIYSYSQYEELKNSKGITDTSLDIFVSKFFGAKGKALEIIGGFSGTTADVQQFVEDVIENLSYNRVIIVSDCDEADLRDVSLDLTNQKTTNTAYNPITGKSMVDTYAGINEKILISSTEDKTLTISDSDKYTNYILKVGTKGIEMLPAAYLSHITVTDSSTISDYNFTIEDISGFVSDVSLIENNDEGVELMGKHFNFDTTLVNNIRNIGGDTVAGDDMVNYYLRILVAQYLTERIITVLASKIKANQSGISKVANAISQEMNTFVDNGYLNTNYVWTNDDLYYNYNGKDYLVCSRNTPLVKGYRCIILPISALTEAQREAHAFPPVYILIADQQSCRSLVINGDVY